MRAMRRKFSARFPEQGPFFVYTNMKERRHSATANINEPGRCFLCICWVALSFIFPVKGQSAGHLSGVVFTGMASDVISTEPAWAALAGPLLMLPSRGWYAGMFCERPYGVREMQVYGGGLTRNNGHTSLGWGLAGSSYDRRGLQVTSMMAGLHQPGYSLAVQLLGRRIHWGQERKPTYDAYSTFSGGLQLSSGIMMGLLVRSPESWFRKQTATTAVEPGLACALTWKPDKHITLRIQADKMRHRDAGWSAGIRFETPGTWQVGAAWSNESNRYLLELLCPLGPLKARFVFAHHAFLGASPSFSLSGGQAKRE